MISFGSVCSGIEAASVAWEPLGFCPAWFSQFDPEHDYQKGPDFPSAVLAAHWPKVSNHGDMLTLPEKVSKGDIAAPEVLVGGTPCQAFSVAGFRKGLSDSRGQLTLKFVELANEIDDVRYAAGKRRSVICWENVPGVINTKDNAFGCLLAGLAGETEPLQPAGKKWSNAGCVFGPQRAVAWRVLDAQYFGVPQRRRRVFVVAGASDGFDPTKILFESEGVRRDSAPCREAEKAVAALTANGVGTCGADDNQAQAGHLIPVGFRMVAFGEYQNDETASTMKARDYKDATDLTVHCEPAGFKIGAGSSAGSIGYQVGVVPTLTASESGWQRAPGLHNGSMVRRLMPVECERLQGFPGGHTDIAYRGKPAADSHRYKALGNSMAVPVMGWIGRQIKNEINRLQLGTK